MNTIRYWNNKYKTELINDAYASINYVYNDTIITSAGDFACGRGGDMHKFYHANYKHITMIDICEESLQCGKERYDKTYGNKKNFQICFDKVDLGKDHWYSMHFFDTVFINFALNQFLKNDSSDLDILLQNVCTSLKFGGIFTGIALDGKRVKELLDTNGSSLLHLTKDNENKGYFFSISEEYEQNSYFRNGFVVHEYFLIKEEFVHKAASYGLILHQWYHPFSETNNEINDQEVKDILKLNVVFKFIKINQQYQLNPTTQGFNPSYFFPVVPNRHLQPLLLLTDEAKYSSSRYAGSQRLWSVIQTYCNDVPKKIIDCCACCGTDTFFLAKENINGHVIAIEKNPLNSIALRHNAKVLAFQNVSIYGDTDIVDYLKDSTELFDVMYFDLPWGGPEYKKKKNVQLFLNDIISIQEIIQMYSHLYKCIIFKIPVNMNMNIHNGILIPFRYKNVVKYNFFVVVR
jgi:mRNA capping enzyme/RNA cap guanine-N2 methyltransferase